MYKVQSGNLFKFGYCLFQLVVIRSAEVGNDTLVLYEDECRHGHNVVLNGNLLTFINIDLQKIKTCKTEKI